MAKYELKDASIEVLDKNIEVQYVPTKKELQSCYEFGKEVAHKLK